MAKYSANARFWFELLAITLRYSLPSYWLQKYAYMNPDLARNDGRHCFVVEEYTEPLPE